MVKNNKHKWMVGAALGVFLCAAGIAMGQSHHPTVQGMGRNIVPETPAFKATADEKLRLEQAAIAALDAGDYAGEESYARQCMSVGSGSSLAQELLAQALYAQGKDQQAFQVYKTMADQGDNSPRDMVPYALLLLKSGQPAQAFAAYNKMLPCLPDVGNHPEDPVIHDGDLMQASSQFTSGVPNPAALAVILHIAQGITYLGDGGWGHRVRNEEAMTEFQKALQLAPGSALANYYYGQGWQQLSPAAQTQFGTAQQAKAALQKAVRIGKGAVKKAATKALQVAMKPK